MSLSSSGLNIFKPAEKPHVCAAARINEDLPSALVKTCFGYARFSTKQQADSDSKRRHLAISRRVAAKMGWQLREDLNAFELGLFENT